MSSAKKVPKASIGNSQGILRNQVGVLKGMLGTVGGPPVKPSKNPRNKS